jgi:hypothetical protein
MAPPRPDPAYLWWAGGAIGRANPDGSHAHPGLIDRITSPSGVAAFGDYVYWANDQPSEIGRAHLDGSASAQAFFRGAANPAGVAAGG